MLRLRSKFLSFSIVSHKIAHSSKDYQKDPTINFYPIVGLKDIKIGTMSLNQPNNQNSLSIQMIDQFFRFLNSYQHDHTVENVWIQNKGSMFLGGLSFQQMVNNPDYLDKLYKMIAMVAQTNKPIFSYINGGVRNVGAYVLSMSTVALTNNIASLRIDQVSKGFIPIAGGSHRLSRLPAKIGFYLALTGKKLNSNEMSRLGFITAIIKQDVSSKKVRSEMSKSNLFFREKLKSFHDDHQDQEWIQWQKVKVKQKKVQNQLFVLQNDITKNNQNVFAKFALNQYKIAQFNYQNAHKPLSSFTQTPGLTVNNYYMMRHKKALNYLQKEGLIQRSQFQDLRLPGIPIDKILKVFGQNNIQDALKNLQNDQSQWAKQSLKALRSMDPLAAHLTYQLLQKAQNLSWDQCLQIQYKVAKRLLSISQLSLKQTYSGSKYVFTNEYSNKRIQDISCQQITNKFFSPASNQQQTLQLQVPSKALLPHKDYAQIPDSPRLAMNRIFFDDKNIANQQKEIKRYLNKQKIDYRNKSFDIDLLRQKYYQKLELEKIQQNQKNRLEIILNNSSIVKGFLDEKFKFIDSLQDKKLEEYLNKVSKNVFNDGIKNRFEELKKTAQIIGKEKKLQIFKNLRKTLIKKIVINGVQTNDQLLNYNQMFNGPIYFDKKNGNVLQSKNPHLQELDAVNKLSQQLENRNLSEQFKSNQGSQAADRNIGAQRFITKRQGYLARINANIGKRYQQYPNQWQRSYEYKQLIKKASQTSQQLAQYLEWQNDAFYTTILNKPAHQRTYNEIGQDYLNRMNQQRELAKQLMKKQSDFSSQAVKKYYQNLYPQKTSQYYNSHKVILQQIFSKSAIPKQLSNCFISTLHHVIQYFQQKYYKQSLNQIKLQLGDFDKYIYENIDRQFVQVYKNDILFVFSYLAILKIKDILHNFKVKSKVIKDEQARNFFKQYLIEFTADQDIDSMNKIFSKFLFFILDMHTHSKSKIRLPQNKLLDFINRTKILRQTKKNSMYPLSFESILLMIGKDRSKLYNKTLQQYLPSQSQYLLEMANFNAKSLQEQNLGEKFNEAKYTTGHYYAFQNAVGNEHLKKKSLISGYQYYLALFDSFIQRASGKYNFANDQLLSINLEKTRKQLKDILNLSQSNHEWLDRNTNELITKFFNLRVQFEKTLTKGQLLAFDKQLKGILNPDMFKLLLKYQLKSDIEATKQLFKNTRHYKYQTNIHQKNQQIYCQIRRNVKNPQAFKRLNNLKMAMEVQQDYYQKSGKRIVSEQEQQDLVQERRQFERYQRYPRQTYHRIVDQTFTYGQEKNFDQYLNILGQKQMNHKQQSKKLVFNQDARKISKKVQAFTEFNEELKQLKSIISKYNNTQFEGVYKRLEQLL